MSVSLYSHASLMLDAALVPASSVLALDTAGRLDRELAAVIGYLDDAAELFGREARTAFLLQLIETLVETAHLLHRQVLDAACRSTDADIATHERGVRARANILMRALYVLKQREQELPGSALVGRFRCARDAYTFLIDGVTRIYATWNEQLGTVQQLDPSTRHALRYIAVDEAEIAFERLGRDTSLATFLRVGATSGSDAVSTACSEIAAVVGLARTTRAEDRPTTMPDCDGKCAS